MKKVAILIATTNGPVLVERITPEPAPQSMVCLSRQSTILPISADYEDFVRLGSGVIIREFPMEDDMAFRLDISGEITSGKSWQLGIFAAHAVFHSEKMDLSSLEDADQILWLSGTVDYDLNVGSVDHIAEKVEASAQLLSDLLLKNIPITFILSNENAEEALNAEPPENIDVVAIQTTNDLLKTLSLKKPARKKTKKANKKSSANPGFWVMAGVALGAVLVLFYLDDQQKEDVYIAPEKPAPERLSLDIFSNQGQSAVHKFGDDLDLWFKTNKTVWVYCFYKQVDGKVLQIYPNGAVSAPRPFEPVVHHHLSGSNDAEFVIRLGPPAGTEQITCYASTQDISLRLPSDLRGLSLEPLDPAIANSVDNFFGTIKDVEWARDQMTITLSP